MKQVTTLSLRELVNSINRFVISSTLHSEFASIEPEVIGTWAGDFTIDNGSVFTCSGYSVYSYFEEELNETVYMVARWYQSQIKTTVEAITEEGFETLEQAEEYVKDLGGFRL